MLLIEGRDERFVNEVGEQNSLWYRVGVQRRRLRCRKSASFNGFLRRRGRLCFYDIGLREFSGLGTGGRDRVGGQISALVDDAARNRLIADELRRRLTPETRALILTEAKQLRCAAATVYRRRVELKRATA